MKLKLVPGLFAIGFSLLIAAAFYLFSPEAESNFTRVLAIIALLYSLQSIGGVIAVSYKTERIGMILRTCSLTLGGIGFAFLTLAAFFSTSVPLVVLVMGLMILFQAALTYSISKSGQ